MNEHEIKTTPATSSPWQRFLSLEILDQIFSVFLIVSFIILVILAFCGRAAEMTVLACFVAISMAFMRLEMFTEISV